MRRQVSERVQSSVVRQPQTVNVQCLDQYSQDSNSAPHKRYSSLMMQTHRTAALATTHAAQKATGRYRVDRHMANGQPHSALLITESVINNVTHCTCAVTVLRTRQPTNFVHGTTRFLKSRPATRSHIPEDFNLQLRHSTRPHAGTLTL